MYLVFLTCLLGIAIERVTGHDPVTSAWKADAFPTTPYPHSYTN